MEGLKDLGLALLQAVILAIVPILSGYLIQFIRAKAADIKAGTTNEHILSAIFLIEEIVTKTVAFVQQTYVDNLKKDGNFSAEEQKIAFEKAYESIVQLVNDEQKELIESLFGNFSDWLTILIEAAVRKQK